MFGKLIYFTLILFLKKISATSAVSESNLAYNLKYIGPHNIYETYDKVRSLHKSSGTTAIDAVKSIYRIKPIVRDLNHIYSDYDTFEALIKREIAWNYPEYNEFGLLSCEDLKFIQPFPMSSYIELNMEGYRVSIQRISSLNDYEKTTRKAKDLQTNCLIKSLEKDGNGSSTCVVNQIPFCFSDSWQQIWWKEL